MAAGVAGKVTFSVPGQAPLTLPVANGYAPQVPPKRNISISGGGVVRTVINASPKQTISIPFRRLTRQQYLHLNSLVAHSESTGAAMSIQDPFETHNNMHYISGLDGGGWLRGDRYRCTLRFRQSATDNLTANIYSVARADRQ